MGPKFDSHEEITSAIKIFELALAAMRRWLAARQHLKNAKDVLLGSGFKFEPDGSFDLTTQPAIVTSLLADYLHAQLDERMSREEADKAGRASMEAGLLVDVPDLYEERERTGSPGRRFGGL